MNQTPVKTRRKFDETFKREAVNNWLVSGKSAEAIAPELGINAEAAVVRERGIDQSERVRKAQLLQHFDFTSAPVTDGCGRPFADAVNRENRRLIIRRRIKRAGCVRL